MRFRDVKKAVQVKQKAIDLIVKGGVDAFSMQKLAKAAKVSPATLYIYYKDKEDLISKLGSEAAQLLVDATLLGFTEDMEFEEGMYIQWKNRSSFAINNPDINIFYDKLRHSSYSHKLTDQIRSSFKNPMKNFILKAIREKKLRKMDPGLFWPLAIGPLYSLVKFHMDGVSISGQPFRLTDKILRDALSIVLHGLKPE